MKNADMENRQAVILAGGLGTRLRPFTDTSPKPMFPIQGKPFIHYLLLQASSWGIKRVVLLLGYLPQAIEDYVGDGSAYGLSVSYSITPVEYGTGARLKHAEAALDDVFLLMYCDNYCPIDYVELEHAFQHNAATVQLSAYRNRDAYTTSNLLADSQGRVLDYRKGVAESDSNCVDIGYALVSKKVLEMVPSAFDASFEECVYRPLAKRGELYALVTEHRYYSIGSYERIALTEQFFSGRKCAFLDRDGTLNVRPDRACYVKSADEFVWIDGAIQAVRMLNDAGFLVILISNQPGIARGAMTEADLAAIQKKMDDDLAKAAAHIDDAYYCTHNWDDGCFCRKPQPGLLFQAQKDYSLNLGDCVFFGDDDRDMQAAEAAACKGILVNDEYPLIQAVREWISMAKAAE